MKKKIWIIRILLLFSVLYISKFIIIPILAEEGIWVDYRELVEILIEDRKNRGLSPSIYDTPLANFEVYINGVLVHTTSVGRDLVTTPIENINNMPVIATPAKLGDKIRIKSISIKGSGTKITWYDLQIGKNYVNHGAEVFETFSVGDLTVTADIAGLWGIFLNVMDNYQPGQKVENWSQYGNWRTTYLKTIPKGNYKVKGWYFTGVMLKVEPACDNLEFAKANRDKCCKELYEKHYLQDGTINITSYLQRGQFYCCEDLTIKVPGFGSSALYKTYCEAPPPPPEPEKCDYKLDTQCPGDCSSQTRGYVKDIGQNNNMQEWKCIFDSEKSSLPKVRAHYKYNGVDNRYCQVYCREEISYQLPKNGFQVEAGHHFTVGGNVGGGTWSPIKFDGYMDCRTKGNANNTIINHARFVTDYAAADRSVVSTYNRWQTEKVRDISRDQAKRSSTKDCDWSCDDYYPEYPCGENNEDTCGGGCRKGSYKGYTYKTSTVTRGDYSARESNWCSTDGTPRSGTPSAASAYSSAFDYREDLKNQIFLCNTWTRNYNEFLPNVHLKFQEADYGFNFGELPGGVLKGNLDRNITTATYYSGETYSSKKAYTEKLIDRSDCADDYNYCVTNEQNYPDNDNKKYEVSKSYSYELNTNVYRYVTKPQGVSGHTPPGVGQYVNMGYPNLPVHYSRLAGDYEISLQYITFGNNNKFNKYIFDKVAFPYASSKYYNCSNTYKCEYEVYNDFMECDPPGNPPCTTVHRNLTVVFRPISLTNPFPGESAPSQGRNRGSNWSHPSDLLKITKNRGLSDPERIFFDRQPMYEITLNTQSILAIRNHNRNVSGGFSDFKLTCITGQGRECKSDFIRTKFRKLFVDGRCGMSTNWNQCSQDDK